MVRKDEVIETNHYPLSGSTTVEIEIKPKLSMVPKVNIIVYYITDDGEIISDEVAVEFENELKNHVS